MKDALPKLLTLPEAARALDISQKAVRAAGERGDLEIIRLTPNAWPRTTSAAVERWIANRRLKAAAS